MSIWRLSLVLVLLAPATGRCAPEDIRAPAAFTIPYGAGAAQVGRDTAPGSPREYSGPSSVRAGAGGELLVCDPRNQRVLRFAPAGQLLGSVTYPAADAHDAETAGVDAMSDRDRNICVLELASRTLLRFSPDGKPLPAWQVPATGSAIFNAVAPDAAGDPMVFDGNDNHVVRFDAKGQASTVRAGIAQSLTMDAGRFLTLEFPDGGSAKAITIWRVDPATGTKDQPVAVALAEPANQFQLLGTDGAGRFYVEVTFGAVEKPDRRQVLVISPAGKLLEGIPVPPPPTAFRMVSSRVVLPGGGFLTATDTPAGLEIRPHALAH